MCRKGEWRNAGLVVLETGGTCMRPWIWPRGRLFIQPCAAEALRCGEIAVWFDGRRLLSHRVLRLGDTIATRADSHRAYDPAVQASQVFGRAVAFERGPFSWRLDTLHARMLGTLTAGPMPTVKRLLDALRRSLLRRGFVDT